MISMKKKLNLLKLVAMAMVIAACTYMIVYVHPPLVEKRLNEHGLG